MTLLRLKSLWSLWWWGKCWSIKFIISLPTLVFTFTQEGCWNYLSLSVSLFHLALWVFYILINTNLFESSIVIGPAILKWSLSQDMPDTPLLIIDGFRFIMDGEWFDCLCIYNILLYCFMSNLMVDWCC